MSANRRVGVEVFVTGAEANAAFAATKAEIAGIKNEAASAGPAASAAMNGVGASAKATAAAMGTTSAAAKGVSASMSEANQWYQNVVRSQGASSQAAQALAAALGIQNTASEASVVVQEAVAQSQEKIAGASGKAGEGIGELHKRVVLGRGILTGYETVIEQLLKSFGGLPLPILVVLPILNALAGQLFKLGEEKKVHIQLDKEQLALDLARNESQQRVVRVSGDLTAAFRIISAEQKEYQKNTEALTGRLHVLEKEGSTTYSSVSQGGEVYRRVAKSAEDLQIESANLNSELGKQEQILGPALEVIRDYQKETHKSTDEVLQWAQTVGHFAPEQIEFFREQLSRTIPVVDELTKALDKLKEPHFDLARTPQGLDALKEAVLKGLSDTFEKGIGGDAEHVNNFAAQVRALSSVLDALDESLKRNAGSEANYRSALQNLNPVIRAALDLHHQQTEQYKEEFKTREKIRDVGPQLELESLRAEARLRENDLAFRVSIIHREFDLRREELAKNGQATRDNLLRLELMETVATTEVIRELKKRADAAVEHYAKLSEERAKDLTRQREFRAKEETEFHLHLVRQRQDREEKERKFFENQAKIERAQRSDRPGRAAAEADQLARDAEKVRAVAAAFGFASKNEQVFALQLQALRKLTQGDFFGAMRDSLHAFADELRNSQTDAERWSDFLQNAVSQMGSSIEQGFEGIVNGTETFGHLMKKIMFDLIASLAEQWGAYYLALGIADIWWNPAKGAAELAAGAALMALAGVLHALGGAGAKSAAATGSSGSAASGGGNSAATGSTQQQGPKTPINVVVPSFPRQQPGVVHFDSKETADIVLHALENRGVFTKRSIEKGGNRRALKNAVRS